MKIFIIDTYYGVFLEDFYKKNPAWKSWNYQTHKQRLFAEHFSIADAYSKNLKRLGCDAEEFVLNNERLQKHWAREKGLAWRPARFARVPKLRTWFASNWKSKIIRAQMDSFKPDVVFTRDIDSSDPKILEWAKTKFGAKIIGQLASPKPDRKKFSPYDLLVSALPNYIKLFQSWGKKAEFLPLAFDEDIAPQLKKTREQYDIVHIGGYGPVHRERNEALEYLAKNLHVDFWGYSADQLAKDSPILKTYHGQAWGLPRYQIMHNAKITATKHITSVVDKYAANLTMFEATGAGSLLLVDWRENLSDYFEIGGEIVAYRSHDDLVEKARYFLEHEGERAKIAAAGQRRTLKSHTWSIGMKKFLEILKLHFPALKFKI